MHACMNVLMPCVAHALKSPLPKLTPSLLSLAAGVNTPHPHAHTDTCIYIQ